MKVDLMIFHWSTGTSELDSIWIGAVTTIANRCCHAVRIGGELQL
jgi:hypothetical protein